MAHHIYSLIIFTLTDILYILFLHELIEQYKIIKNKGIKFNVIRIVFYYILNSALFFCIGLFCVMIIYELGGIISCFI